MDEARPTFRIMR